LRDRIRRERERLEFWSWRETLCKKKEKKPKNENLFVLSLFYKIAAALLLF